MTDLSTIARPYAEAAFKAAREDSTLAAWSDAIERLASIASMPQAVALIANPRIADAERARVFQESAAPLSAQQLAFVALLANNDRLPALPSIAEKFGQLRREHESVRRAEISTAYPLDPTQIAAIRELLEKKVAGKVEAVVVVVPELIGGVSIRIGDEVMDASVRGKLAKLASAMAA